MARVRLWVVVGILVFGSTSVEMKAQSPDDTAKQLVGMWRLVSSPQRLADGTTRQGQMSVAYIIYTDTNPVRMCAVLMDPNRPKWKTPTIPTADEAVSGINGLSAYCGTVEVHAKEGFVLHHVEIEKRPDFVGRTRKRWFTFEGPNRVTLRVDPAELSPPTVESTFVWERVQ